MNKDYVVGFMFSEDSNNVVLIRKAKPEWQKGKLNGVGGKIEEYDKSPAHAMVREYFEEAYVTTLPTEWKEFCILEASGCKIHMFACADDTYYNESKTCEKEEIVKLIFPISVVEDQQLIPNLRWLLPFARHYVINAHKEPEKLQLPVTMKFDEALYKEG